MTAQLKPFSKEYVLRTTRSHMLRNVEISIDKTFNRVSDFANDQTKSNEIFETLAILHTLKKQISGE